MPIHSSSLARTANNLTDCPAGTGRQCWHTAPPQASPCAAPDTRPASLTTTAKDLHHTMTAPESPPGLLLPGLGPTLSLQRRLSTPEYYHACIGSSPTTLEQPREIVFVIEGEGRFDTRRWETALARVVAMNPGARLRLVGKRLRAQWKSDGPGPHLRPVSDSRWDGRSQLGSDFITATPLDLETGRSIELLLCDGHAGQPARLIVRVLHAVMDGVGVMHFLQELFRALRSEPLQGCNAAFSDTDLMRSIPDQHRRQKRLPPAALTGDRRSPEQGDSWRRLSLHGPQPALLARTALAMAAFARQYGDAPVRMAFPVNLRRHCPGLLSTLNFSSMLHIEMDAGDDADDVREKISQRLASAAETHYPPILDYVRCLPLPWLDRLVSRTAANYTQRRLLETAVISNLGHYRSAHFSCEDFRTQRMFGIPIPDNAFAMLFSMDDRTDITIGMANVYASDGRLDALMDFMQKKLS